MKRDFHIGMWWILVEVYDLSMFPFQTTSQNFASQGQTYQKHSRKWPARVVGLAMADSSWKQLPKISKRSCSAQKHLKACKIKKAVWCRWLLASFLYVWPQAEKCYFSSLCSSAWSHSVHATAHCQSQTGSFNTHKPSHPSRLGSSIGTPSNGRSFWMFWST